ncbi:nuclear transport factor 2 family protein [Streptomyces sp. NPDC052676]|uniref:ester cyclase n=1 Tax=Streptomyces sp. NPDC052676 TaxID=3154953 RepID=UPI0034121706
MGEARELMDRLTASVTGHGHLEALAELYAEDAVALTPDGELRGRDAIVEWWGQLTEAVPDASYRPVNTYEVGDTAIDEGVYSGRNTGPVRLPSGEALPPTNREFEINGVDLATVRDGRIVSYRVYYDQVSFLDQLGLLPGGEPEQG